ncbi:MAG TPA: TetR/AcrR family transcriptional regulator [Solirubrobacteraceae bacterium]|nr:TetR/AcrR family transcriptional regulator [Solirubrobacteraceae bacterium]
MPQPRARTKAEQGEATRARLVRVARRLFASKGYGATSIGDITSGARVTRGALYHHFPDKAALFEAVFLQIEEELGPKIGAAVAAEKRPERRLEAGLNAFLDACLDAEFQRIVMLDAPSVLGWERWHEIDAAYGLGMTQIALQSAMEDGYLRRQDPEPLAHLILGALNEAGLAIARADDVGAARRRFGEALEQWVDGLRP